EAITTDWNWHEEIFYEMYQMEMFTLTTHRTRDYILINPDFQHTNYYSFLGRYIGMNIFHKVQIEFQFPTFYYVIAFVLKLDLNSELLDMMYCMKENTLSKNLDDWTRLLSVDSADKENDIACQENKATFETTLNKPADFVNQQTPQVGDDSCLIVSEESVAQNLLNVTRTKDFDSCETDEDWQALVEYVKKIN
ncbi:unnamed protein product, partial [Didymodactylos carnosus]